MVVEGWLHRAARTRPGATALEGPDGTSSRSYAELHAAARRGARALSARGVGRGDRVAIALAPGLEFAEALHACLLLGAVAVPVDLRLTDAERARVCDGAAAVVSETSASGERAGAGPDLAFEERHDLDALAAVIHTSGTSAAPRPIELTYGNFLWSALGSAVALDVRRSDRSANGRDPCERWLCVLPVAHVGGLSILVRSAIYATTAVMHPRFDTDMALRALRTQDITLVSLVSTTLARLLDAGLQRPTAGAAGDAPLRCALTGGGPIPDALLARARDAGVPVRSTYGLTEACSQVTTGGPPLFCTRVRIDGASERTAGGRGSGADVGEILVSGPTVAPGSRDPDGWLHTGDLGALDERGFLRVSGRVADTIVSGGENVAPAEVEAVLESHPDVLEAAVLGREHPTWGQAVAAIVVPRPGAAVEGPALRAYCAERLARYKVPKQLHFTREPLPRTASGKLLRRNLT
ncbi:MAG TPA: AMP-binding protein [Solirubrobacteraceae bacterium]|jgi:O-succinylbenzoic acid--CoA ligase|nr:AMP-binding protein [Solirubrobacteraceae bacterium]